MVAYKKGMTVTDLLTATCSERGINGTELGRHLGVSQATGSRWLSGENTPADERAPVLADFIGIPVAQVVAAMHEQRVGPSVSERLSALEERVNELAKQLEQIAAQIARRRR